MSDQPMSDQSGRGRFAETPSQIPYKGWKDIAFRIKDQIGEDHVGLIAAGVAYYALLALFPTITALIAIGGLLIEPSQIVSQLSALTGLLPQEVSTIVIDQAKQVAGSEQGGLGLVAIFGLALALWSASRGMVSLIEGLNVAYDEEEKRGYVRLQITNLLLMLLLLVALLLGLGVSLVLPIILSNFYLGAATEIAITVVTFVAMIALTVVGLAVLYRYGPSRRNAQWRWLTPGAAVACVAWLIASAGFAFYVGNFGSYNESFGSLAGVIVMLTWLWISAYIVLLGAEINSEIEALTRHDTTVGEGRPMGERNAVKADTLGEAAAK